MNSAIATVTIRDRLGPGSPSPLPPVPRLLVQLASAWRARPGSNPRFRSVVTRDSSVVSRNCIRIPIAGRDEWEEASRQSA